MGNQAGAEGFYEDDKQASLGIQPSDDNKQNGHNNGHNNGYSNGHNNGYGSNGQNNNVHHQNSHHHPQQQDDDDISIYQSQYAMNLYGVTDSGEFVHNAVKRIPKENKVDKIKELFKYKKLVKVHRVKHY